jgi:hypothetical protein
VRRNEGPHPAVAEGVVVRVLQHRDPSWRSGAHNNAAPHNACGVRWGSDSEGRLEVLGGVRSFGLSSGNAASLTQRDRSLIERLDHEREKALHLASSPADQAPVRLED